MRTTITIWLFAALTAASIRGFTDEVKTLPKVVFLVSTTPSQDTDGLFLAIRAQLSGAALTLERAGADSTLPPAQVDMTQAAPHAAAEREAAVVFWVETGTAYRVRFFIPSSAGGRYFNRSLEISPTTDTGRDEVIGIAAAVAVEDILITRRREIAAAQALAQKRKSAEVAPPPAPPPLPKSSPPRRFEITAAYAGLHFAADMFGHGGGLGVGFIPIDHLVVGIRFRMIFPMSTRHELMRLSVLSRTLFAGVAVRLKIGNVDLRAGLAYVVDLRSFSVDDVDESIDLYATDFVAVHAIAPHMSIGWVHKNRVGLFAQAGADVAVNEADYKVRAVDGTLPVVASPWTVKASIEAGIQILL